MSVGDVIIPLVVCTVIFHGVIKGVDVFDCFIEGAKEGAQSALSILPSLIGLMTCVGVFKASGALDVFTYLLSPIAQGFHFPREVIPLGILRPISGSGALAVFNDILTTYGPDSYIGRVASVLEGSTETTVYTIAVYYGAIGITDTKHTLPAGLLADLAGFIMSAVTVRMLFGMG